MDFCDDARGAMSKKDFKLLLWEEYISFCQEHPEEFGQSQGSTTNPVQTAGEVLRVPISKGDMARRFNPSWSNTEVEAALAVEQHLLPMLRSGELPMGIFGGDAGWSMHKEALASTVSVCTV